MRSTPFLQNSTCIFMHSSQFLVNEVCHYRRLANILFTMATRDERLMDLRQFVEDNKDELSQRSGESIMGLLRASNEKERPWYNFCYKNRSKWSSDELRQLHDMFQSVSNSQGQAGTTDISQRAKRLREFRQFVENNNTNYRSAPAIPSWDC